MAASDVRHFRLNPAALTARECWRLAPDWPALRRLWAAKFRAAAWDPPFPILCPTAWPPPGPQEFPPGVAGRLAAPVELLGRQGFRAAGRARVSGPDPAAQGVCSAHLVSADGVVGAGASFEWAGAYADARVSLTTRFTDGTFGITTTARYEPPVPGRVRDFQPGLPTCDLYARHLRNLGRWVRAGRAPAPFAPEEAGPVAVRLALAAVDHLTARGVLVELAADRGGRGRAG